MDRAGAAHPARLLRKPDWRWIVGGKAPALDCDWTTGRGYNGGGTVDPASLINITRNSIGFAAGADGMFAEFPNNVPRITSNGLRIGEERTNAVCWSRDLTNAVWTKTNITAVRDQVGMDGRPNMATRLTATAANGAVLQMITQALSSRAQSAYVKRLVGSGAVQMTMDGGATWTTLTVTAAYTRVSIPAQTIADPTVGFRLAVSGDSIAVDFIGNENGAFQLSSIETGAQPAMRDSDTVWRSRSNPDAISVLIHARSGIMASAVETYWQIDDGTNSKRLAIFRDTGRNVSFRCDDGSNQALGSPGAVADRTLFKFAFRAARDDFAWCLNGGAVNTDVSGTMPTGLIMERIGSGLGGLSINGEIIRHVEWSALLTDADLVRVTS